MIFTRTSVLIAMEKRKLKHTNRSSKSLISIRKKSIIIKKKRSIVMIITIMHMSILIKMGRNAQGITMKKNTSMKLQIQKLNPTASALTAMIIQVTIIQAMTTQATITVVIITKAKVILTSTMTTITTKTSMVYFSISSQTH